MERIAGKNGALRSVRAAKRTGSLFVLVAAILVVVLWNGCSQTTSVEVVSLATNGALGNRPSYNPIVSGDGRYVAFESEANNLVSNVAVPEMVGQFYNRQIYVRDLQNKTTEIVSLDYQGKPVNGPAFDPSISYDGRYVSFSTRADEVVPKLMLKYVQQVYVRDRQTGETKIVSTRSNGWRYAVDSGAGRLVPDGRGIFFSLGNDRIIMYRNLLSNDTQELLKSATGVLPKSEVLVQAGEAPVHGWVTGVSQTGGWFSFVSSDGIPFMSRLGTLFPAVAPSAGKQNVFLCDFVNYRVWTISLANTPVNATEARWLASTSNAGANLVFFAPMVSSMYTDEPDSTTSQDVYAFSQYQYNSTTGPFCYRLSKSTSGQAANGDCVNPAMTNAGFVAFESLATNLVSDDTNKKRDIFLRDTNNKTTTIVSRGTFAGAGESNGESMHPSMSNSDSVIAFESLATNMAQVAEQNFARPQIYARRVFAVAGGCVGK